MTIVIFISLGYWGIKSQSKMQPYHLYSPIKFIEYRQFLKDYPLGSYIKDFLNRFRYSQYSETQDVFLVYWENAIKKKALFDLTLSAGLSFAFMSFMLVFIFKRDIQLKDERFLRGASFVDPCRVNDYVKQYRIVFGKEKVRLPISYENTGLFLFGSPGSGKSTFIKHLIPQITGDPIIIYDRKPEFYPLFYEQSRDLLFDPSDNRTIKWNIFKEIQEREDIDNIVRSLIPLPIDPKSAFWYQAAQDIFIAIFTHVWESEKCSNKKLIDFLYENGNNRGKLFNKLKHYPQVEGYISKDNNTSNSVMSVVAQFSNALIQRHFYSEGDFSIREYIRNPNGRLFIVNRIATEDAFKTYFTLFLDLAFREFLSREVDRNFRFWFIIDEFPTLMKLETLQHLLAEGRDRGSCVTLGAQDFEQVKKKYGADAYSIFNQTNTKIIFHINDPNTTEYISRSLGEQEVAIPVRTLSAGTKKFKDGYSFSEQQKINRIILPSEIKGLPALKCYVSLGEYPVTKISVNIFKKQPTNHLVQRIIPEIKIIESDTYEENEYELLT